MSPLRRISPAQMTTPIRTIGLEDIREEDNEDDIQQRVHNPPPCTTFTSLPSHTTPPSRHYVESRQFCWTIDDVAKIRPAPIEENQIQQYEQPFDPEIESKAQEAIDHPWGPQPASETSPVPEEINESYSHDKQPPSLTSSDDDDGHDAIVRDENVSSAKKREVSTQTMLTLPPQLPRSLEATLKPYFMFTQVLCPSIAGRTYGTPLPNSEHVSSPEISPISSFTAVHQRNKSFTRLNFSQKLLTLEKSSRSPSVSPLGKCGLVPIHHEDDHYPMQETNEGAQENKRLSSCMITSGTSTPEKNSHGSSSEMITSGTATPVRKFMSFSEDISMDRTNLSGIKTKFKEFGNTNDVTVGEGFASFYVNSNSEIGGINLHNHDTGYQTGSISCNMSNLHSGAASTAFSAMSSVSRNWSSIHFNSVGEKHANEGFYGDKCNFAVKSTMEDNSVWLPSSKYIVSSTPTKFDD
ncbi:hypothetical protein C0J52_18274 [Blattella germanica]|nr:hypothetical protein C0J52_18274 [Blattella germanica]